MIARAYDKWLPFEAVIFMIANGAVFKRVLNKIVISLAGLNRHYLRLVIVFITMIISILLLTSYIINHS